MLTLKIQNIIKIYLEILLKIQNIIKILKVQNINIKSTNENLKKYCRTYGQLYS